VAETCQTSPKGRYKMNYPYPEFHGITYKVGDRVQVYDAEGNLKSGEIVEKMPSGRYRVQVGKHKVAVTKDQIFPAPKPTSQSAEQSSQSGQPTGGEQGGESGQHEAFTPNSLAKHMQDGGKAYYYPAGDDSNPVPVHDVWFGKEENLSQFIDFDAVNSGSARIEHDSGGQTAKPKSPRFQGMTESEYRVLLQTGSEFVLLQTGSEFGGFDQEAMTSKSHGGHSLEEMIANRDLATDDNVKTWFDHHSQAQTKPVQPVEPIQQDELSTIIRDNPDAAIDLVRNWNGNNESAQSVEQVEPTQSAQSQGLDALQVGLDAIGTVEPTPFADGANAAISLARAGTEPERAGEHLKNAATSVVSMIPYVGDLAKGAKYAGKAANAGSKAAGKSSKAAGAGANATGSAATTGAAATAANSTSANPSAAIPGNNSWLSNVSSFVTSMLPGGGSGKVGSGSGAPGSSGGTGGGSGQGSGGGSGGSGGSGAAGSAPNPGGPSGGNAPVPNMDKLTDEVVEVAGVFGTLGKKAYDFADHIDMVNRQMIEANREMTRFNGQLSAAYGQLDADRMGRNMRYANQQGESLSGLVGSQSGLEDAMQDFKGDWQIIGNDIQQVLTRLSSTGISILDVISPFEELYPHLRKALVSAGILNASKKFEKDDATKKIEEAVKKFEEDQKKPRKIN
jgi:hypothetical protein